MPCIILTLQTLGTLRLLQFLLTLRLLHLTLLSQMSLTIAYNFSHMFQIIFIIFACILLWILLENLYDFTSRFMTSCFVATGIGRIA